MENSQKISVSIAQRLCTSAVAMPPSQLKQLKTSLRETGILGPQQSKKKKRQNAKSGAAAQNRLQRNAALQGIRERFNPFEIKAPVKSVKFDVTTRDAVSKGAGGAGYVRPGVTKSLGEERVSLARVIMPTRRMLTSPLTRDERHCFGISTRRTESVVLWTVVLVKTTRL